MKGGRRQGCVEMDDRWADLRPEGGRVPYIWRPGLMCWDRPESGLV